MSMGANMMGMQGPGHGNSCSSAHIPSMHSEAKLVSACTYSHRYIHIHACTNKLNLLQLFFFHRAAPATLRSQVCVDFIIWSVTKAVSEPASAAPETLG